MSDSQLQLLAPPRPPEPPAGVRLLCDDVTAAIRLAHGCGLVHADPPWQYSAGVPGNGKQGDHYGGLPVADIAAHVDQAFEVAADDCYLVLWCTWPFLEKWTAQHAAIRWRYATGGSWTKYTLDQAGALDRGGLGIGYNWRGESEPILLYAKGKPRPRTLIRNAHVDTFAGDRAFENALNPIQGRARHSEKPLAYLCEMLEAFSDPGDQVLDLYAGLAPLARAAVRTGRRYIGAEIDPERRAAALSLLAQDEP